MNFPGNESSILEFKREVPSNHQIVKTAIGLCNTNGGKIVIGVENDGRIIGLPDTVIEDALERLELTIIDSCTPRIVPRLYAQHFEEKSVLIIELSEGMNKPYYLHAEGEEKGTYIRLGRHTIQAKPEIIQELKWQSKGIDYEKTPVFSAPLEELNNNEIEKFIKNRKNSASAALDEQILKAYGLIVYDQSKKYPSVAGILLFGRNPQYYFSESMIICSQFKGTSGRETIATVDCEGTLFNQFKQAFEFIWNRLYKSFTIKGLKREMILEIPEVAIREALLNMIVHRNYHLKSPSKIAIYEDRVELFSPGGFPGPFLEENLLSGITYLRNPAICKILREAKYIEKLGSGIIEIFNSYDQSGLETPKLIDGGDYFKCILPRTSKKPTSIEFDDNMKILTLFDQYNEISIKDIENKLRLSRSTALRRLNDMINKGIVYRVGKKRNVHYKLLNIDIEDPYWENRGLSKLSILCFLNNRPITFFLTRSTIRDCVTQKNDNWQLIAQDKVKKFLSPMQCRWIIMKKLGNIQPSNKISIEITENDLRSMGFQ